MGYLPGQVVLPDWQVKLPEPAQARPDRQHNGVFRGEAPELIFAYFCSGTKVGRPEAKPSLAFPCWGKEANPDSKNGLPNCGLLAAQPLRWPFSSWTRKDSPVQLPGQEEHLADQLIFLHRIPVIAVRLEAEIPCFLLF